MCDSCSVTRIAATPRAFWPELTASDCSRHHVEEHARQKFRRGVVAVKCRLVVEIPVVHLRQNRAEDVGGAADVDDQTVGIELGPAEFDVNDICGAVQLLSGPGRSRP